MPAHLDPHRPGSVIHRMPIEAMSHGPDAIARDQGRVIFVAAGAPGDVADVEITLTPINLVLNTDKNGLAVFKVPPGDYFVDAHVCCAGPGNIDYHLPVAVQVDRTTEVELGACLECV